MWKHFSRRQQPTVGSSCVSWSTESISPKPSIIETGPKQEKTFLSGQQPCYDLTRVPDRTWKAAVVLFGVPDHKILVLLKKYISQVGVEKSRLVNTGNAALGNLSKPYVQHGGSKDIAQPFRIHVLQQNNMIIQHGKKKRIFMAKTTLHIKFWHINLTLLFASALDFGDWSCLWIFKNILN